MVTGNQGRGEVIKMANGSSGDVACGFYVSKRLHSRITDFCEVKGIEREYFFRVSAWLLLDLMVNKRPSSYEFVVDLIGRKIKP